MTAVHPDTSVQHWAIYLIYYGNNTHYAQLFFIKTTENELVLFGSSGYSAVYFLIFIKGERWNVEQYVGSVACVCVRCEYFSMLYGEQYHMVSNTTKNCH